MFHNEEYYRVVYKMVNHIDNKIWIKIKYEHLYFMVG